MLESKERYNAKVKEIETVFNTFIQKFWKFVISPGVALID